MKKTTVFLLISGLLCMTVHAGTFYIVKEGDKTAAGTYNGQKEFVQTLKKHMASDERLKEEEKEVYGLMFFIMAAPRDSIERVVDKRIMDFYNYPEKYDFRKDETTHLYGTKEELLESDEIKQKTVKHGHFEVFIIGIDVKYERMHSISKANGVRIFLDSWYQ